MRGKFWSARASTLLMLAIISIISSAACSATQPTAIEPSRLAGASPSATASTVAPAQCSDNPTPTNTASTTGIAIEATEVDQKSLDQGFNFALTASEMNRYPELLSQGPFTGFDAMDRALNDGVAYSPGGASIHMSIRNVVGRPVTIYDMRPVNTRILCPPSGLLVLYGNQGGGPVNIYFDLDAASPVAHQEDPGGDVSDNPYFPANAINVPTQQPTEIQMNFAANKWAHSFDIGVDYLVDGKRFTQVIQRNNKPFLTTPSTCPSPTARRLLDNDDVSRLRGLRFKQVRLRTDAVDANGRYIIKSVSPEAYANECQTW